MPESPQVATYEDFKKLQLIVATIVDAQPHPNADKLFVIRLSLGDGSVRQIVAGIRPYYQPEQLVGRQIVLVANLEPRVIRGVESHGMLLAAQCGDGNVVVLSPESKVSDGASVS